MVGRKRSRRKGTETVEAPPRRALRRAKQAPRNEAGLTAMAPTVRRRPRFKGRAAPRTPTAQAVKKPVQKRSLSRLPPLIVMSPVDSSRVAVQLAAAAKKAKRGQQQQRSQRNERNTSSVGKRREAVDSRRHHRFVELVRRINTRGQPPRAARLGAGKGEGRRKASDFVLPLAQYPLPSDLADAIAQSKFEWAQGDQRLREALHARLSTNIPQRDYKYDEVPLRGQALHDLLWAEEALERHEMRQFDVEAASLRYVPHSRRWVVPVEGLAEKRPSVLVGDSLILYDVDADIVHKGFVHVVHLDTVEVALDDHVTQLGSSVNVYFEPNGTQWRVQHRAIDDARMDFSPDLAVQRTRTTHTASNTLFPYLNRDQQFFIDNLFAAPRKLHLLWGPPGTGKTSTLVHAVSVLARSKPHGLILVAAPSNTAVDHFVSALLRCDAGLRQRVRRVHAPSRSNKEVPADVLDVSNPTVGHTFDTPLLTDIVPGCIVCVTLSTAGSLYSIGVKAFDIVVVDEAGQATETDLLLVSPMTHSLTRFLLAGDPKQLGPVRPPLLAQYALARAPLMRLIDAGEHRAVMLRDNYRNVEDILSLFNPSYDNELVCRKFDMEQPDYRCRYDVEATQLLKPHSTGFVQAAWFVHCHGEESRVPGSPSWMNAEEAETCANLVGSLLTRNNDALLSDFVVLTPYLQQVKAIKGRLRLLFQQNRELAEMAARASKGSHHTGDASFCPVTVATVEQFQGKESRVVILSCVRSVCRDEVDGDVRRHLGFLSQPERLNVALSRAQELLIIVGNGDLLQLDPEWRRVIKDLLNRGCVVRL